MNKLLLIISFFTTINSFGRGKEVDKIVDYLKVAIESNEIRNEYHKQAGDYDKINYTLVFDYNQLLETEPSIFEVSSSTVSDVSDQYPLTKQKVDFVNFAQDKLLFYNVIIKDIPNFIQTIQHPENYRYGEQIVKSSSRGILDDGYYNLYNYKSAERATLLTVLQKVFDAVSSETLPDRDKIFNFFATTDFKVKNEVKTLNFVHTQYYGDIYEPFLGALNLELQSALNTANTTVFSNDKYSVDTKIGHQLNASIDAIKNVAYAEATAWEYIFPEGWFTISDEAEEGWFWNWDYWEETINLQAGHILIEFLDGMGMDCRLAQNAANPNITKVFAKQELEDDAVIEYEIELHSSMGRDALIQTLRDWGLTNEFSYSYYIFSQNRYDDIGLENYGVWMDQYYLKKPPFLVDLIARIIVGPAIAVYGYATGKDALDGHELAGWEHLLNALDIIPVAAVFTNVGKGVKSLRLGIKNCEITSKIGGVVVSNSTKIAKNLGDFLSKVKSFKAGVGSILDRTIDGVQRCFYVRKIDNAVKPFFEILSDGVAKLMNVLPKGARHDKIIGELGQFTVKNTKGELVEKYIKLVKTADGQVYIKAYDNTLGKLEGYSLVKAWYNSIPDVDGFRQFKHMMEEFPLEKLSALEADFKSAAGFTDMANSNQWLSHAWLAATDYPLIRVQLEELNYINDYLISTGKTWDEVAEEIAVEGGYVAWKGVDAMGEVIIDGISYFKKKFGKFQKELYVRYFDEVESIQYYFPNDLDDEIASFNLVEGSFIPEIDIPFDFRGQGIGSDIFNDAFSELGGSSVIDDIESTWIGNSSLSDNFDSFKQNLVDGMSPSDAALNTATGSWANDLGYNNVLISAQQANEVKEGIRLNISPIFTK